MGDSKHLLVATANSVLSLIVAAVAPDQVYATVLSSLKAGTVWCIHFSGAYLLVHDKAMGFGFW